uniref:Putative LOV domain-containing protein n=1 Tax=Cymbomonas sp. BC-2016 TaxID=1799572 RepID=A0A126X3N7_9CHLO|nr:putative LOV domain-containing protein [Cymbomonas sp. BC-2016]
MKSGKTRYSYDRRADQQGESADWICGSSQSLGTLPACEGVPPHICGGDQKVRQRISDMLEETPSGLIVCDALEHDCPILYVNPVFEHVSGYSSREILGRNCRFLQFRGPFAKDKHESVDREASRAMQRAVATGSEYNGVLVNFTKNGTPFINSIYLTPLYSDTAEPSLVTHFAAVLRMRIKEDLVLTPIAGRPPMAAGRRSRSLTSGPSDILPDPKSWKGKGDSLQNAWLVELGERELGHILSFLDMQSILRAGSTCKYFRKVVKNDSLWRSLFTRFFCGPDTAKAVEPVARRLGWFRVVKELHTLNAVSWRSFKVGGSVYPGRTKFATCSVGNKILVFGGEAPGRSGPRALNDTFLLDLDWPTPMWVPLLQSASAVLPPARWGHTLQRICGGIVVLFGGCDERGRALNDTFIMDLLSPSPQWQEVKPRMSWISGKLGVPPARSWHAASSNGRDLVVFGGCNYEGRLLDDTWQLDMSRQPPAWHEVLGDWNPQPRLGASLCYTGECEYVMFGGLASTGAVRLRSNDLFTLNLSTPSWKYVSGSTLPSGATQAGTPPLPRLEQNMGVIGGGRVIVFGGSNSESTDQMSPVGQPYVCNVSSGKPRWQKVETAGTGPEYAWGYSTAHLDDLRFVTPGSYQGRFLGFNELFELSFFTPETQPKPFSLGVSSLQNDDEHSIQHREVGYLPGPSKGPIGFFDPFAVPSWNSEGTTGGSSGASTCQEEEASCSPAGKPEQDYVAAEHKRAKVRGDGSKDTDRVGSSGGSGSNWDNRESSHGQSRGGSCINESRSCWGQSSTSQVFSREERGPIPEPQRPSMGNWNPNAEPSRMDILGGQESVRQLLPYSGAQFYRRAEH